MRRREDTEAEDVPVVESIKNLEDTRGGESEEEPSEFDLMIKKRAIRARNAEEEKKELNV